MRRFRKLYVRAAAALSLAAVFSSGLPAADMITASAAGAGKGIVYSHFGREAVFAAEKTVVLRARPEKDGREIAKASKGDLLWRVEEDADGTGWDKINYSGVIVYCENDALSEEDPDGEITVTTNKKYYEGMKEVGQAYAGNSGTADSDMQAEELADLSGSEIIEKVGPLFTADMKNSGILASVSLAQFILESGYGKSELAQNANNCFGMKADLSGNSWPGSAWDGVSTYSKKTSEQKSNGAYVNIVAEFRSYPSISDSIADHSAYLAGAETDSGLRYDGLVGCTDYKTAVKIIKNGGYATSHDYVQNICKIIEKWDLTRFDA